MKNVAHIKHVWLVFHDIHLTRVTERHVTDLILDNCQEHDVYLSETGLRVG